MYSIASSNSSSLPTFYLRTHETLSSLNINDDDIFAIIKNLNPNKFHGWDNRSIRAITLCGKSIVYPLKLIFEASLQGGEFPDYWKKANLVPVHKKESKNLVKNYRPISLLLIFGKIFERVIFKDLFLIASIKTNYLLDANLAFYLVILAFHSYYLLFMISTLLLTVILHRMLGVYF